MKTEYYEIEPNKIHRQFYKKIENYYLTKWSEILSKEIKPIDKDLDPELNATIEEMYRAAILPNSTEIFPTNEIIFEFREYIKPEILNKALDFILYWLIAKEQILVVAQYQELLTALGLMILDHKHEIKLEYQELILKVLTNHLNYSNDLFPYRDLKNVKLQGLTLSNLMAEKYENLGWTKIITLDLYSSPENMRKLENVIKQTKFSSETNIVHFYYSDEMLDSRMHDFNVQYEKMIEENQTERRKLIDEQLNPITFVKYLIKRQSPFIITKQRTML